MEIIKQKVFLDLLQAISQIDLLNLKLNPVNFVNRLLTLLHQLCDCMELDLKKAALDKTYAEVL